MATADLVFTVCSPDGKQKKHVKSPPTVAELIRRACIKFGYPVSDASRSRLELESDGIDVYDDESLLQLSAGKHRLILVVKGHEQSTVSQSEASAKVGSRSNEQRRDRGDLETAQRSAGRRHGHRGSAQVACGDECDDDNYTAAGSERREGWQRRDSDCGLDALVTALKSYDIKSTADCFGGRRVDKW
jgi:hypothetical protein